MRKKIYCAGGALSACFGNVAAVASLVVGSVVYIPAINCMGGPGESFVRCFVDEDFCTWRGHGSFVEIEGTIELGFGG